ncbi:hypothetical protein Mic7113_3018 [Allocoleopsis franciscana PCC 7113]|uniref:Uncharacterized protein n=1 Tax=Allocoleopsis franciscana PCC 7113 TaxID=1173027 RepID=K9WG87_9CYAN|nr:hypothetical protein Mic7113_3018 [Allocoleopsis franciscana PCC 7113]
MIPMPTPDQPSKTSDLQPVRVVQLPPRPRSSPLVSSKPQSPQPDSTVSNAQSSRRLESISSSAISVPPSVNQPNVTETPSNRSSKLSETTVPKPEPAPTALPSNPPVASQPILDAEAAQSQFQVFITAVKTDNNFTTYSLLEILELFGQPGQIELFFNQQEEQKPGILEFQVLPDKSLEQVIQEIVQIELGDRQGFTLQEQQSYGSNKVFAATKHGFTRYIHVVPLNARSGSLLIIWDRPPSIAIQ